MGFDFASWSSKDLDGKNHLVTLNALEEPVKFVFSCQSKTCDEEPVKIELYDCKFENGKLQLNSNDTIEGEPEILCLKGDPIQGFGTNIWKGNYTVNVLNSKNETLDSISNMEVGTGAAYTFTVQKVNDEVVLRYVIDITSTYVQCVENRKGHMDKLQNILFWRKF